MITHFAADDYKPACDRELGDRTHSSTTERAAVTCLACKGALSHPHRGALRRELVSR